MKNWFESLEVRERLFVSIGAVVVTAMLLYGLGWAPLEKKHSALRIDVQNWERALSELRPLRTMAAQGGQPERVRAVANAQSPIIIVDQTLRSRGLEKYRRRSQPTTSNGIRVEFENVAFDDLVLWLGDLSSQYAMHVQSGSLTKGSQLDAGRVNATLTLERAL